MGGARKGSNSCYREQGLEQVRMSDPLTRMAARVAYAATQLPRVAWYAGHDYIMRRLAAQARRNGPRQRGAGAPQPGAGVPAQSRIYADLADLLAQDLANVERG